MSAQQVRIERDCARCGRSFVKLVLPSQQEEARYCDLACKRRAQNARARTRKEAM